MTSYHRSATIILVLLTLFLSCIIAQTKNEPFALKKSGKEYYIQPVLETPTIDGNLTDLIWSKILPITDFVQEDPDNMAEPTEKTAVYLTYNDKALYIAARMYDSDPSGIARQLAPQDDWYDGFDEMTDWFRISLDSRHDHQTSFAFAVNASGVIYDEMVYRDEAFDSEWNAIWQAEVLIDDKGWSVEIEIPFSNIPFYQGDKLTWGMNITRFIQRKYETITWVAFPLEVKGIVSKYGHLNELKGIYPPAKFEFRPYSMVGLINYNDIRLTEFEIPKSWELNYTDISRYTMGLDLKYNLSTNSKMQFTINPDFGQVESDPEDVNLTSYETYFIEKRPFFLYDTDIFNTPIELFYSRRIGGITPNIKIETYKDTIYHSDICCSNILANTNSPIDTFMYGTTPQNSQTVSSFSYDEPVYYYTPTTIKTAGKFTGRTESGLSYGLLSAVTTFNDGSNWANQMMKGKNRNYFVSRIKQDLLSGTSFVGFMSTSSLADSAHTFSMDGMANFFDNQIGIDGQIVWEINGHDRDAGIYGSILFSPLGSFSGWIDYFHYGKGLDINDVGYLYRDNYSQTKLNLKFQTLEPWNMIRKASIILEGDQEKNTDGLNLGKTIELSYDILFENFWKMGGRFIKAFSHYDDRKIIIDYDKNEFGPPIFIPEINEYILNISSDTHLPLAAMYSGIWGDDARDGLASGNLIELTYRPNSHLLFSISYDHYQMQKQYQWLESFIEWDSTLCAYVDTHSIFSDLDRKIDILTFNTTANVNPKLSFQGYLEIFLNQDIYNQNSYSEYLSGEDIYSSETDYIKGSGDWLNMPVYSTNATLLDSALSYLDPSLDIGYQSKFTSLKLNGIIKWNYMKGSNIYFVYSFNKSVNGTPFSGIGELGDFLQFNKKQDWVEVLRDQTFMIKIDYWFEK